MSEPKPSFALLGNDGKSRLSETGRLRLEAVNGIHKLRLQVSPRAGINPVPLEGLPGITLPAGPQEKVDTEFSAYWLAPDDWLLVNPAADADSIKIALRDAVGGATAVVTDMTDAWSIIDISGDGCRSKTGCKGVRSTSMTAYFPTGRYAIDPVAAPVNHYPPAG